MKIVRWLLVSLLLVALGLWAWPRLRPAPAFVAAGDIPLAGTEWQHYAGDAGGLKYAPLTQVNRSNVHRLEQAWAFSTGDALRYPDEIKVASLHATPILLPPEAGRHLVFCTPFNRIVALDPATGAQRWDFDAGHEALRPGTRYNCRGVSLWHDRQAPKGAACEWRIFMGTNDRHLVAVDARDGKPCAGFGTAGVVDVNPLVAADGPPGAARTGISFNSPPALVGDTVVLGSTGSLKFHAAAAPGGAIRAFDARSGAHRWSFDPIPRRPDDPLHGSWTPAALDATGGAEAWSMFAVDEARDLLFVPTSSPAPDFNGVLRPGDNRYANSLVALRGSTGEVVWHFQIVHHDTWDLDVPSQPILTELERDGRRVPVVIQLSKVGMVFVFHRETGEPFYPIEERAVPTTGGVPGEQLSPTQPFTVRPAPLVPQNLVPDDAWGVAPPFKKRCRELIEQAAHGPLYTPIATRGTVFRPGSSGGMNWGGGAFEPASRLLVTPVSNLPFYVRLVPRDRKAEIDDRDPMAGFAFGPPGTQQGTGFALEQRPLVAKPDMPVPCVAPPWSELVAVDMDKAEVKWRVPLGTIDRLSPVPLPLDWGTPTAGGPIVTAGRIVVMAGTTDRRIRAWDLDTGRELWQRDLPLSGHGTPMTYEIDGRQFFVVVAAGHMFLPPQRTGDQLVAFALPR